MKPSAATDHRWSMRKPLMFDVTLYEEGATSHRAQARNISLGGMFLELEPAQLAPNKPVVLGFALENNGDVSYHRLPASVVHVSPTGAGLMFGDCDLGTIRTLRRAIYNTRP